MEFQKNKNPYVIALLAVLLAFYPLRHVTLGVDIWDAGYNYANFQYNGLEYMDSMWFFATWLANGIGALLTKLPGGGTVVGLNVYTALFVSAMAVGVYLFCVYRCKIPAWLAFAGEVLAMALCWAPTAVLYNYLTYLFLAVACLCLYKGLQERENRFLVIAGIILGLNVGVRFSNLVQMGLILVVWGYALITGKKWTQIRKETGLCILGYGLGFGSFLLLMSLKYGFFEYWESVLRLFQMTEVATDYTPGRMLLGMIKSYWDCSYWLKRFALVFVFGVLVCVPFPRKLQKVKKGLVIVATAVLFWWLHHSYFYSLDYAVYESVFYPCVTFFLAALFTAGYFLIKKGAPQEDKLKALFVVLLVLIGTLGSNNAMYSGINNTFVIAPFTLYLMRKLCREEKRLLFFPIKCILVLVVFVVGVQALRFGHTFSYEEATGGRNMTAEITEISVLRGMRTSEGKARNLTELYQYMRENNLGDRKCILFGQIPGIAYYMELKPAMNTWSDLRSYGYEVMAEDIREIEAQLQNSGEYPVIIMEASWAQYMQGLREDAIFMEETTLQKLPLLKGFIEKYGYQQVFFNEKYVVFTEK